MNTAKPKPKVKWWQIALIVPFVPVIVAIAGTAFILFLVSTICLHITIWAWWCLRGRDILFVYSDSPIWRDYIEKQILPHIGERTIVLNCHSVTAGVFRLLGWRSITSEAIVSSIRSRSSFVPSAARERFAFGNPLEISSTGIQKHFVRWRVSSLG